MTLVLHDYWRSSAAYRVRIALNLKGIPYCSKAIDLRTGAQRSEAYLAIAPQGLVPAILSDGQALTQSLAIIEWLDETYPEKPLMPADTTSRAVARAMALSVACDIHPLNNLRVLNRLRGNFGVDQLQVEAWISHWITEGFHAIEKMIGMHGDGFSFGSSPTIVDCCLVPQVYSATRFGVSLEQFPRIVDVAKRSEELEAFSAARPEVQSDAD